VNSNIFKVKRLNFCKDTLFFLYSKQKTKKTTEIKKFLLKIVNNKKIMLIFVHLNLIS